MKKYNEILNFYANCRIKFKIEILAWKRKYLKGTTIGDGNKTLDKNTQVNPS